MPTIRTIWRFSSSGTGGFTVLELVIVILIVGILATLALPALTASLLDAHLMAASNEVTVALEYAQQMAVTSGRPCKVTVGTVSGTSPNVTVEQIEYGANFDIPAPQLGEGLVELEAYAMMPHPLNPVENYVVDFDDYGRFDGVSLTSVSFGAGNFVVFDSRGAPSSAGTIALETGGLTIVITVDGLSGKVTSSN